MDSRCRDLIKQGDRLFDRTGLMALFQEIALHFYPERADFTGSHFDGNYAEHLFSSYPVLARRELGNLLAANLRPRNAKWFAAHVSDEQLDKETEERRYLEYLSDVQWRAMYDPIARFVKATKEADHDYAAFGQAVIEVRPNSAGDALLFRNHHLRDCAWSENAEGKIDVMHRKWRPTARQLAALFPKTASKETMRLLKDDPEKEIDCRHIIVPERLYRLEGKPGGKLPFTCLYVECETETVLEETPQPTFRYVVPRWQTVSHSQYARSPATEVALPDARTLQAVVRTLREAGEKHVDPPLIATQEAIRSDLALYPGGVTWVDSEFDDRTNDVLRPLDKNPGTMPIGVDIAEALREDIRHGFYLDKLMLPELARDMTAYEVNRRLQEHVRASAPLFEPVEEDYNAALCNETFEVLKQGGAFGPKEDMPESLWAEEIHFTFQSPLREVSEQARATQLMEGLGVLQQVAVFDPAQIANVEMTPAVRDALEGLGWPAEWLADAAKVQAMQEEIKRRSTMQLGMQALGEGSAIAEQFGKAGKAIAEAESVRA